MPYIEIKNVSKIINGNEVLKNINIQLEEGKIYGLVGKNGSGKTMLIRALSGLISLSDGEIIVGNKKVLNGKYPDSLGIVIENIVLLDYMSAFANLKLLNDISKNKITDKEIEEWLNIFDLRSNDKRTLKKYSLGMKQKVSLIQAFMNKPKLIILDEPTNALDEGSVGKLLELIKKTNSESKTTFIVASHDKDVINDICDEIIEMRDGKIV